MARRENLVIQAFKRLGVRVLSLTSDTKQWGMRPVVLFGAEVVIPLTDENNELLMTHDCIGELIVVDWVYGQKRHMFQDAEGRKFPVIFVQLIEKDK